MSESLETLQRQLDSLDDLHTIVRTMKALSAARIRQYEDAVRALAGYARTVRLGLHVVLRQLDTLPAPGADRGSRGRRGLIVFGSDHGLCGRFNEEIGAFALNVEPAAAADATRIAVMGGRVAETIRHAGREVHAELEVPASPPQITAMVHALLPVVDDWQRHERLHTLTLCFNRHHTSETYRPTALGLLPLDLRTLREPEEGRWPSRRLPTFSMDRDALLSRLLHQHLFVSLFRACAESQASEHAARLEAMQSAQRNIDERLDVLTTQFRRTRQEAITAELLDVVGGFEAVSAIPP